MKKILIVNNNMHIGGVQKSLVNLLNNIADKYDITLLLFSDKGSYMGNIPDGIKVKTVSSLYRYIGLTKYDVTAGSKDFLLRSFFARITRVFGRKRAIRIMGLSQKTIDGYDIAISYLHDGAEKAFYGGCNDFVLSHVNAKRKIAFLHCDYAVSGANTVENAEKYSKFDIIAACSEGCKKSFVACLPQLSEKTVVVPNFHNFEEIEKLSTENSAKYSKEFINIVTVARLGKEKGVKRAVRAISKLNNKKNIQYHVIGDGIERIEIEKIISDNHMENTVIMYGEKSNPYPYMKNADLLLIPSVSEAAPMVIGESAFLGTPILSTDTSSAVDMVEKTGFGWVCENSIDGIKDILQKLIDNPEMIKEKAASLSEKTIDNSAAVENFVKTIEERTNAI